MQMKDLSLPLDRELFLMKMIRAFAGNLEETVGLEEAGGYVALVGSELGEWIDRSYRASAGRVSFTAQEVAELLVDLKQRIGGKFFIVSVSDDAIVLGNSRCPFDEWAIGRPSLCRMTSNVFGRITANELGYARIGLERTIAKGDGECHIVIHLSPDDTTADLEDHEFFRLKMTAD